MPRVIVSVEGVVIKEVPLTKDRTTLGRRPYNDIVIDNLAVSGEHALFERTGAEVYLEDLRSTNGSYINGKAVKKQLLKHGDVVELGKYRIEFVNDGAADSFDKTMLFQAGALGSARAAAPPSAAASGGAANSAGVNALAAVVKVLSGAGAGRELPLTKVVTTVGKPGVAVAAITRRQQGFVLHHIEGVAYPALNGQPIGPDPVALQSGDLVELAGTQMQFNLV